MIKKEICPASVKILNFNLSTGLSVIHHDQMDIVEQAATNILMIIFIE